MKILKSNNSIVFEEDDVKTILPLNNLLYINNGNSFSFRTKNGRRLFSVKYDEITEPTSSSVEDLIGKLNGLFNSASGGGGSCKLQEKSVDIIQNGVAKINPDTDYDGMTMVTINVNVPSTGSTVVNGRMYVTSMANEGFSAQQAYNSIQMPNDMSNVTSLANAFSNQSTIEEIVFPSEMPNVLSLASTFSNCTNLHSANVNTPKVTDMSNTYSNCNGLKIENIIIPNTVENLSGCFNNFRNKNEITEEYTIENLLNLTNINSCFSSCYNINKITLRNLPNLTETDNCFSFSNIKEIDVSEIGLIDLKRILENASFATKIILPNNLERIESFYGCSKLESIDLPLTLKQLPSFNSCESLIEINGLQEVLPNIVEGSIGFSSTRFTSLDLSQKNPQFIPNNLYSSFTGCDLLTEINLDNWDLTNTKTDGEVFGGCTSLQKISLNNSNFTTYSKLKEALTREGLQDQVTITPTYEPEGNDIEIEFNQELGNVFVNLNEIQYEITETPFNGNSYSLTNGQTVSNINRLFADQTSLTKVSKIPSVNSSSNSYYELFFNCVNLIEANISNSITGKISYCAYWFNNCPKLQTIYMDGILFNNYASAENLFTNCTSLQTIYLRNSDDATKNKITEFLTNDGLQDQVTIVTE